MAIVLPLSIDSQEIRVLQEFRRRTTESLPMTVLAAIKHPSGGGEAPVLGLVRKAFLTADGSGENFTLTQPARDFLAIDARPENEEPAAKSSGAAATETE